MNTKVVSQLGLLLVVLLCCLFPFANGQEQTDPQEVAALRAVRRQLQDPSRNLNWSRRSDPCIDNWRGILCRFNQTDGFHHVEELRLIQFDLSGTLAPELGLLVHMKRLDFLWNHISGSIPREVGNMAALELMLLSGNRISGSLPDELGNLGNLTKFQLDINFISGPIPRSFANLSKVQHFHMNNNTISGQIPPEIATLPLLKHVLLDNNNLSGFLPPEISLMPSLTILQLDNNNFSGTTIPASYANMTRIVKLSLRNCSLQGTLPDITRNRRLLYLDVSMNNLTGPIPASRPSQNLTTIILSNNQLNGSIPANYSGLPRLQRLYLDNNLLSGSVPSDIWSNINFTADTRVDINLETNFLSDVSGILNIPENVTLNLQGNPVCSSANQRNISQFCGPNSGGGNDNLNKPPVSTECKPQSCPTYYQYVPTLPADTCFCAAPFGVGVRLRSPSISKFPPYRSDFDKFITSGVIVKGFALNPDQLYVDSISWEVGPRLRMFLLFFPVYSNSTYIFEPSEVLAIAQAFATFAIPGDDTFGPYDLLNFTALGPYANLLLPPISTRRNGLSKGAVAGIVVGSISFASVVIIGLLIFLRKKKKKNQSAPAKSKKDKSSPKVTMKMDGVKPFSFEELQRATSNFNITAQIGQGGYGKVYRGTLEIGTVVAIKRAQQGSLQGEKEFYTEIEMLSRLHHRNLVSLVGYCDEKEEQMLVYEFMPNGSLHDLLSTKYRSPLNFATRLHIALGASRGILYLHTEADPPIIHRDIKANNILLDSRMTPKVSDFGISRLAPVSDNSIGGRDTTAHVSTNVKGTPGYVDPDYYMTHKLTEKSDVYSLGVVFLELLTGMQPISHGRNIVREVNTACQAGLMFSVIDRGMGPYPSDSIKKFMALALRCSSEETKDRPLMLEVVRELENIFAMLPETDTVALEMNLHSPNSGTGTSVGSGSGHTTSNLYDRRSPYVTMDLPGSDLVSGVFNTVKPR